MIFEQVPCIRGFGGDSLRELFPGIRRQGVGPSLGSEYVTAGATSLKSLSHGIMIGLPNFVPMQISSQRSIVTTGLTDVFALSPSVKMLVRVSGLAWR